MKKIYTRTISWSVCGSDQPEFTWTLAKHAKRYGETDWGRP